MKKILIVEDNAVNRELLRELLETRGYEVSEACDGQEALTKNEEVVADILLVDIGMPVLDGYGFIRKFRETPKWKDVPVLAVTAYAMEGDKKKILDAGFDGYLSKPIEPAPLDRELARLLT